jgi:uroporphyrinogen III methyltransferase/synthase
VADGRGFHDDEPLKAGAGPTARVYFVGAGPGHPDLLTLRAVDCLGRADVVVHDGLVPPALLEAVGCRAERMLAPRSVEGCDPGEATGRLLAQLAASGGTIVRLKGGDPAVFGRLAEELQPLREAGIPFEIVPGVTAALAAAAAAGVPLTSRQAASSLTILTGHEADEKEEGLDFPALAGLPGTLAIYMGVEQVQRWSRELISAGKPADTPVTVISRCSWPDQRIAVTTLGACGTEFERCQWPSPAIVIVGDVAEARPPHAQSPRPLAGRRILVTRPQGRGDDLAAAIAAHGGECIQTPVIRIEPPDSWKPLDRAIAEADTFDWIVFASANGVRSFVDRLRAGRRDGRHLGTARLAAIGPSTAAALEAAGLACDLEPERSRSEGIVESLGTTVRRGRFLLLRADRGRDVMRRDLEALGHHVTEVAAYSSRAADSIDPTTLAALDRGGIDWITITSSFIAESAARLFGDRMRRWKIASLSPVTSGTLEALGLTPTVEAASPTAASLAAAIAAWESSSHSPQPAGATKNDQPPHSAATGAPTAG